MFTRGYFFVLVSPVPFRSWNYLGSIPWVPDASFFCVFKIMLVSTCIYQQKNKGSWYLYIIYNLHVSMYIYICVSICIYMYLPTKKTKEVQYSARRMRFSPLGNDGELRRMSSQIHHPSSSTTSEQWLHNPCWLMV